MYPDAHDTNLNGVNALAQMQKFHLARFHFVNKQSLCKNLICIKLYRNTLKRKSDHFQRKYFLLHFTSVIVSKIVPSWRCLFNLFQKGEGSQFDNFFLSTNISSRPLYLAMCPKTPETESTSATEQVASLLRTHVSLLYLLFL